MKANKQMTIWTWGKRVWVMGGDVDYILKTSSKLVRRFKVRGFEVACVEGPAGRYRCAECITGAIVTAGFDSADDACKMATDDIKSGKPADMRKQIEEAKYCVKSRSNVTKSEEDFWQMLNEKASTPSASKGGKS